MADILDSIERLLNTQSVQTLTDNLTQQNKTAAANTGTLPPADKTVGEQAGSLWQSIPTGYKIAGGVALLVAVYLIARK